MNRSILTAAVGVTLAIALAAGAIAVLDPFGPSWVDPETARCDDPATAVVSERDSSDHREIDLTFTCEAAVQAATIYLPPEAGQHPAVVWVHGAGNASRIVYDFPLFTHLVQHGIAVLTYDKRGVSRSAGVCCPGDDGHFNLLTADVEGAMAVLRSRLLDMEIKKQREADSVARRSMVGSGDRSDKIRTYNFPQDRVTDHRPEPPITIHALPKIMDGDLDGLIDALNMADQADRLATLEGNDDAA